MANARFKHEIERLFYWSIKKAWDNNEGQTLNLHELFQCVAHVWDDLFSNGDAVHETDDND